MQINPAAICNDIYKSRSQKGGETGRSKGNKMNFKCINQYCSFSKQKRPFSNLAQENPTRDVAEQKQDYHDLKERTISVYHILPATLSIRVINKEH